MRFVVLSAGCLLSVCLPLFGSTIAVSIDPATVFPAGAFVQPFDYSGIGWQFTPTQDISVTALGVYDGGPDNISDGLNSRYTVGLFLMDGSALVSTTVPAGTAATLLGGFRYADISPFLLSGGVTYVIASTKPANDPFTWAPPMGEAPYGLPGYGVVAAADPTITLGPAGSARYLPGSSATLAFPTRLVGDDFSTDVRNLQFGPNFQFDTSSPEPATWYLMTLSVIVLFARARRTRRHSA